MSPQSNKAVPYVIKDKFIQVTLPGKAFSLDSSHPTFPKLREALKKKNWAAVPKLVNLAESISLFSEGEIDVSKGVVRFKGRMVESSLTQRILEMIDAGKPAKHLIRFMSNLYRNPSERAIHSFYDWLVDNDLPITDDGCFLAYKSVDMDYLDTHSKTVNNRPGQIIMMSRRVADDDYDTQCATGYHICSKQYGLYGTRVLAVKANPKHILSAVSGKMRVTQYEVLKDLGLKNDVDFRSGGFSELEKQLVVEVKKERKEIIRMLLTHDPIKRLIRRKKLSKKSLIKASYARLKSMLQRYDLVPSLGPEDKRFLSKARMASGLTVGQVAKSMGVSYKTVATIESKDDPKESQVSNYLYAISELTGRRNITYPVAVA